MSFISHVQADDNPLYWNSLLSKYRSEVDAKLLTHSFDSLIATADAKDKTTFKIIHKVILADLNFKKQDQENKQSEKYFNEAYILAQQSNNIGLQIWTSSQFGYYYYTNSNYSKALPYFLESSRAIENYPASQITEACSVLIKNAYYFGSIKDNSKSIELLKKALSLSSENTQEHGTILYALGALYMKTKDYEKAQDHFLHSLEVAKKTSDEVRYAKALGELALIHHQRGESEMAVEFLLKDIKLSEKNDNKRNTMYAQIQLGRLYFDLGELKKAQDILSGALQYAKTKTYLKGYEKEILEIQLKIAITQEDDRTELATRRELDLINHHISLTNGQEIINKINWQTQKERIQWELDAKKAKLERSSLLKWIWSIVSVLLSLIILLLFKGYRKRLKLEQVTFESKVSSFELEKIKSETILRETHNSLDSFQEYLEEKNQQIEQLEIEIRKINNIADEKLHKHRVSLESLLDSHLMNEENWTQFKEAFIADKEEFYNDILTTLPCLTESNLRIILLQNLGLNNQQVAQLLGVTIDAIKKSKQRMRKKYGDRYDQLTLSAVY